MAKHEIPGSEMLSFITHSKRSNQIANLFILIYMYKLQFPHDESDNSQMTLVYPVNSILEEKAYA